MTIPWRIALLLAFSLVVAVSFFVPGVKYTSPGIVLLVGAFLVARRAPHIVVCATFAYLCFEQFVFSMLSVEVILILKVLPELLLLVVMTAMADGLMRRSRAHRAGIIVLSAAGFMVLVSGLFNDIPLDDCVYYGRKILRYIPLVLIMPAAFDRESRIRFLQRFIAGMVFIQLLVAGAQVVMGESAYHYFRPTVDSVMIGDYIVPVARQLEVVEGTRLIGTLGTYMDLGLFLFFAGCFISPFALGDRAHLVISRWLVHVLLVGIGMCLVMTFSRLTILAAVVALGAYLLRQRQWFLLASYVTVCIVVALVPFLIEEFSVGSAERATNISERLWGTYSLDYLDPGRYIRAFLLFIVPPAVMRVSPFFGIGPGFSRMPDLNLPNWVPIITADNGYVSLLIQFGLLGVVLFITMQTWLIKSLWKTWAMKRSIDEQRLTLALLTFLVGIPAAHLFVDVLTIRYGSFMFWMACGLAFGVVWREKSSALQLESAGQES